MMMLRRRKITMLGMMMRRMGMVRKRNEVAEDDVVEMRWRMMILRMMT
jgi:hypothetical protein